MSRRLPLLPVLVCALLACLPHTASAAPPWAQQKEDIACDTKAGSSPFYAGDSASARYDATFAAGHVLPPALLDSYVPQGLGAGAGYILQTAYNDDAHRTVITGMVPGGGQTGIATLLRLDGSYADAHAGGVAAVGKWIFVTGQRVGGFPTMLRFNAAKVAEAMAAGTTVKAGAELPLKIGGFDASFMGVEGGTLFVGMFDKAARNRMYRFTVGPKGGLKQAGGWVQVPKKTQGLAVTPDHFVFSTSYGSKKRSNVYVVRRGKQFLDNAYPQDLTCFAAPSMSEGLAIVGDQLFLTFESGSFRYRGDPCDKPVFEGDCTRNVITSLHRAPLAALTGLT